MRKNGSLTTAASFGPMNTLRHHTPAGIINLYKPPGRSSAQYVYRLRQVFGIRKVGHAGTLDPFADGVLLGCVGRGTKLVEALMYLPKQYESTLRLGVTNATLDPEQPFEPVEIDAPPTLDAVSMAVADLVGEIDQVPPIFSAVKIDGVPSYKLAARGKHREKPARRVHIHRITILDYQWPLLRLDILCGRGTYIRAIARDIGSALQCGACCQSLTRTAVGPFRLPEAINLDKAPPETVLAALISVPDAQKQIATAREIAARPPGKDRASDQRRNR